MKSDNVVVRTIINMGIEGFDPVIIISLFALENNAHCLKVYS